MSKSYEQSKKDMIQSLLHVAEVFDTAECDGDCIRCELEGSMFGKSLCDLGRDINKQLKGLKVLESKYLK